MLMGAQKYLNNYVIGCVLSSLVRGILNRRLNVEIIHTKFTYKFIEFLYRKGLIWSYNINGMMIKVFLKYDNNQYLFSEFEIISKPSARVYWNLHQIKNASKKKGRGIYIISTHLGLKSHLECVIFGLGGEVLCKLI
jgi:ribosomal protein S8